MPAAFARTLRSLDADRPRRPLPVGLFAALAAGWAVWFLGGQVTLYEVSAQARLEVACAVVPVAAEAGGRVEAVNLPIGRTVQAGDVLVVLDAQAERLALAERRARHDGLAARLRALRDEIRAEQDALPVQQKARAAAVAEARAQVAEAEARSAFAEQQVRRLAPLHAGRAASDEEYAKAKAEAMAQRAAVRALELAADRLEQDRLTQERDRDTRLAKLRGTAAELEGEAAVEVAAIRRLEHEVERRTLRAPAAGRVGEASELRAGAVVRAGDKLATLVPTGGVRAVAYFPAAAGGRLRAGQSARLRLDGFPWTVYGTLAATVAAVADEPSDGRLRVELTLSSDFAAPVPAEHGLPGSAEVAVERVSPARLALRAAGQLLADRPPAGGGRP